MILSKRNTFKRSLLNVVMKMTMMNNSTYTVFQCACVTAFSSPSSPFDPLFLPCIAKINKIIKLALSGYFSLKV